ncbi:hypothetical protein Golomagni_06072 [Golovinomyces magnicellulatus]|nr:hypothetical protein Golomagni_06072 [Golovinomyces magnicellulatus]
MLRHLMQRTALPARLSRNGMVSEGAWNGAWRRLFTSEASSGMQNSSRTFWQHNNVSYGTALRRGTMRPKFNSNARGWTTQWSTGAKRGFRFSAWRSSDAAGKTAEEKLSLSDRLKKLIKEYGWATVGVYLALSVLDFPFCFLLVRIVGTEKIGKIEHYIVSAVKTVIPESVRNKFHELWSSLKKKETKHLGNDDVSETVEMAGWGVEKASERNSEEASLATQLALAYAIHKSFIFLRVPLTAAVTPKVVKVLRGWGWNIGKKKTPKV